MLISLLSITEINHDKLQGNETPRFSKVKSKIDNIPKTISKKHEPLYACAGESRWLVTQFAGSINDPTIAIYILPQLTSSINVTPNFARNP